MVVDYILRRVPALLLKYWLCVFLLAHLWWLLSLWLKIQTRWCRICETPGQKNLSFFALCWQNYKTTSQPTSVKKWNRQTGWADYYYLMLGCKVVFISSNTSQQRESFLPCCHNPSTPHPLPACLLSVNLVSILYRFCGSLNSLKQILTANTSDFSLERS